ncbi:MULTISPECIES: hypothetical protein [unclassified Alteromonas]|uniref:hypothetical protein n=1 Tax=unclassified Alteromonas TaxID=2614992 RepID=UPI001EF2DD64|nr:MULTISPECIES: hypothetical protein [unclassified Alteromonas]MCG7638810.1 hypothetical protein [Alteromonas sp. CNT1-28]MCG7814695.1 hypothetical protein [Alteromonas sp. MCA-1]
MLDVPGLLFLISSIAVPGFYVYMRGGTNRVIFVLANVGIVSLVGMALSAMESTLIYLNHTYLSSLYPEQVPRILWPVFEALEWIEDWFAVINVGLMIVNTFISPVIMYKYCNIFSPKSSA